MSPDSIELLQFPYSHFNEKVRWALDWKGVPHRRTDYLPGPHAPQIEKLTGQTQVPVVRFGEELVHGSARIIDELERRYPEPPLYPEAQALRDKALEIQAWFDEEIGPRVRRALFSVMIEEPGYLCGMFSITRSLPVRAGYRAMFQLVRAKMAREMGLTDPQAVEESYAATERALDFVAKEAGAEGFLVGDRFSVADLTAAALLAPACNPPDSIMTQPEPAPEAIVDWRARWADHPGTAWVHARYRDQRPAYAGAA